MIIIAIDAKDLGKLDGGTVGARLIPALDTGTYGTCDDCQEQNAGDAPLVQNLISQDVNFGLIQSLIASDVFVAGGIPGDKGSFANNVAVLFQPLVTTEFVYGQQ